MSKLLYTVIPDTSDATYWEMKPQNTLERSSTFVPRNKELHQQLKQKAWHDIQARIKNPYKDRHKIKD